VLVAVLVAVPPGIFVGVFVGVLVAVPPGVFVTVLVAVVSAVLVGTWTSEDCARSTGRYAQDGVAHGADWAPVSRAVAAMLRSAIRSRIGATSLLEDTTDSFFQSPDTAHHRYDVRTFAQNVFACGSMVLCLSCVSFLRLQGQKRHTSSSMRLASESPRCIIK
jgi:hypothetical protein